MHILYMPCMSLKIVVVAAAAAVVKMTMCENVADTLDFME